MVEAQMVRRMIVRGLVVAPFVIAALGLYGGWLWAYSAAIGFAMTLGNLWLSGRIIGGVADRNPQLLMVAGLATFGIGLILLTGIALALRAADIGYFPVIGLVLIGSHFLVVLWEAAGAHNRIDEGQRREVTPSPARTRSS